MKAYKDRSREELEALKNELETEYKKFQDMGLSWICPEESRRRSSWIFPWE